MVRTHRRSVALSALSRALMVRLSKFVRSHPAGRDMSRLRRFHGSEPVVMPATVLQWLVLSTFSGGHRRRLQHFPAHCVYPEQKIALSKSSWIFARPNLPVGQEKVRLSYGLLRWWHRRRRR